MSHDLEYSIPRCFKVPKQSFFFSALGERGSRRFFVLFGKMRFGWIFSNPMYSGPTARGRNGFGNWLKPTRKPGLW